MSDVISLSRPAHRLPVMAAGNCVPLGASRRAEEARQQIAEFLEATTLLPGLTGAEMSELADARLNAMSSAERTFLEIEMTERTAAMHTFDYDPIWGRR